MNSWQKIVFESSEKANTGLKSSYKGKTLVLSFWALKAALREKITSFETLLTQKLTKKTGRFSQILWLKVAKRVWKRQNRVWNRVVNGWTGQKFTFGVIWEQNNSLFHALRAKFDIEKSRMKFDTEIALKRAQITPQH